MERPSATAPFSIQTSVVDRCAAVHVVGELDLATSEELLARLHELVGTVDVVEIDGSGLSFVDSAGLHALVRARQDGVRQGVTVRVVAASVALEQLLDMTNLRELLAD